MRILPILIVVAISLQCSTSPTSPKYGVIAVSVQEIGSSNAPIGGIKVDLLQTSQTKMTDSTGIAAFQVNPGNYTVRVYNLQLGGPVIRNIDSTVTIAAGKTDTLHFFECLVCV